jgi:phosphatidylglycerophosphate synthase
MAKKPEIQRVEVALLSGIEQPLLKWLVPKLPSWISPDCLTAFGLAGHFIAFFAFLLTNKNDYFLWVVNLGLVISWFGDSMDGTVARFRRISTKHGFYIDHMVDAFSGVLLCVGWGLSPYLRLDIGLYILIAYLMMSIRAYMFAMAGGVFKIDYAGIGGTEIRALLFILNCIAFYIILPEFSLFAELLSLYDLIGLLIVVSMGVGFFIETGREMIELMHMEKELS